MKHILRDVYEGMLDKVGGTDPNFCNNFCRRYGFQTLGIQFEDKNPRICPVVGFVITAPNTEIKTIDVLNFGTAKKWLPAVPN